MHKPEYPQFPHVSTTNLKLTFIRNNNQKKYLKTGYAYELSMPLLPHIEKQNALQTRNLSRITPP